MPYTPYTWQIGVGGATPIDKTNLDHLETQYDAAITIVRKTADQIVNNSNVVKNDDDLFFAIGANETWVVKFYLDSSTSVGADIRFDITAPALATIKTKIGYGFSTTLTASVLITAGVMNAGGGVINFSVVVINGANAGNIQLQWAQTTAEVSDTKVLEDSYIVAHQLV